MGAPWYGRWQLPAQPAYCGLQTAPLASRHNTAALPCKAHSGYAD
ncbi:hypothetical protein QF021_001488 [Acidovorax delafieldii]|nr:hypothetical protein [Acidovorax delafieldii]